jgi:hypothetical protein
MKIKLEESPTNHSSIALILVYNRPPVEKHYFSKSKKNICPRTPLDLPLITSEGKVDGAHINPTAPIRGGDRIHHDFHSMYYK